MNNSRAIDLFVRRYLTPPWTGPVVRRDPDAVRTTSVQHTWRCAGAFCGQWTMDGAHLTGRCNFCGTPRPVR